MLFHEHRISGDTSMPTGSVLMIGNHISWWDGFWAKRVNHRILKRRLHVMMLEEQLRGRLFLSRMGAFSIRKNHRDAINSLEYAANLLSNPQNMVVLFPQGRFQSLHQHPVSFEKGWFRILQKAPENTQLLFMANMIDYFDHPKPTLTTRLKLVKSSFENATQVEDAYNDFLTVAINAQDLLNR